MLRKSLPDFFFQRWCFLAFFPRFFPSFSPLFLFFSCTRMYLVPGTRLFFTYLVDTYFAPASAAHATISPAQRNKARPCRSERDNASKKADSCREPAYRRASTARCVVKTKKPKATRHKIIRYTTPTLQAAGSIIFNTSSG